MRRGRRPALPHGRIPSAQYTPDPPTHPPGPGRARGVCADSARCGRGRRERCKYVVYSSALLQYFSNYSGPGGCAVPPRPRLHCLQTSGGGRNHGLAQHRFSCFESVVTSAAAIVRNSRAFAKSPGTSHFARAWSCTPALCLSFQLRAAAVIYASEWFLFILRFYPPGEGLRD